MSQQQSDIEQFKLKLLEIIVQEDYAYKLASQIYRGTPLEKVLDQKLYSLI